MRVLHRLLMVLLLIAGLAGGSLVHPMERAGSPEVTAATEMLHHPDDHDQVPADADKNYPHHHNQCHGHDLAAGLPLCAAPTPAPSTNRLTPKPVAALAVGPPDTLLRPPIA